MKKTTFLCLMLALMLALATTFTACTPTDDPNTPDEPTKKTCKVHKDENGDGTCDVCDKVLTKVTYTSWKIMTNLGSEYETTVHKYVTNVKGPTIAIIGGTHGDEVAGWTAGLQLVEDLKTMDGICGTVLLIPQVNILADRLQKRYAGQGSNGMYNGVKHTDLNRAFPGSATGTVTQKIANAIVTTIEEYSCDYIIDLHESRASYSDGERYILGDSVIYSNGASAFFVEEMIRKYNTEYKPKDEVDFSFYTNPEQGSFDQYFSDSQPDTVVFTVETNRDIKGLHGNQSNVEVRVRQQLNILSAMFDMAWSR